MGSKTEVWEWTKDAHGYAEVARKDYASSSARESTKQGYNHDWEAGWDMIGRGEEAWLGFHDPSGV